MNGGAGASAHWLNHSANGNTSGRSPAAWVHESTAHFFVLDYFEAVMIDTQEASVPEFAGHARQYFLRPSCVHAGGETMQVQREEGVIVQG